MIVERDSALSVDVSFRCSTVAHPSGRMTLTDASMKSLTSIMSVSDAPFDVIMSTEQWSEPSLSGVR